MKKTTAFVMDGKLVELDYERQGLSPTTTVLNYLRSLPERRGTKEGCAEGDCGACTVVLGERTAELRIRYRAVDACLIYLPMLHGKELITVEDLRSDDGTLHPVQRAMIDHNGSQCGFCTPGIVMSLFAYYKKDGSRGTEEAKRAIGGNLCRCTGYRSILDAAATACRTSPHDQFETGEPEAFRLLSRIPQESISILAGNQRYDQPATLAEALALIHDFPAAVLINGATDIALRTTKKFESIPHIVDCSRIGDLRKANDDGAMLTLGAGLPITDVAELVRAKFPAFGDMLDWFGSTQIRNLATLGGNIGTASPIGDTLPVLMACNASIVLTGPNGVRSVPASDFVFAYRKTERRPDELITAVVLPHPKPSCRTRSYKVSKRRELDISTVSAALSVELAPDGIVSDIRLAFGGMADRPRRANRVEEFLKGKEWSRGTVEASQRLIDEDFQPISDVRGSAAYRSMVARNLLLKFWNETSS